MYLATASGPKVRDAIASGRLGQMVTPNAGNRLVPGASFAIDNGCFSDAWSADKWIATLRKYQGVPGCLFAVVPDKVCDAAETNRLWRLWAPLVKSMGYKAAYVTQNGCTGIPVDADVLFTGGDDEWKLGPEAQRLVRQANMRGIPCHMGRVNSLRRIRQAAMYGYDSVDGTFLAFGPDVNLPKLLSWLEPTEPNLWGIR